jgi:hypothetical protein
MITKINLIFVVCRWPADFFCLSIDGGFARDHPKAEVPLSKRVLNVGHRPGDTVEVCHLPNTYVQWQHLWVLSVAALTDLRMKKNDVLCSGFRTKSSFPGVLFVGQVSHFQVHFLSVTLKHTIAESCNASLRGRITASSKKEADGY